MADKSFGVKQLNLIGSTGTPTIESPGNLNLNASVVAISTDATVGRSVGIGTSATSSWAIDAIGKVRIGDGQGSILPTYGLYLTESGASNNSSVIDLLTLNSSPSGSISAGHGSGIKFTGKNTGGGSSTYASIESVIEGSGANSGGALVFKTDGINGNNTERLRINESGNIGIGTASPIAKLDVNGHTELDSVNISGIVTATTFSGSGSSLTGLNATQLTTGTVPGNRGVTAGSSSSSFVEYNGTTRTSGQFYGGTTAPNGTTRLNYSGNFYATNFYGDGSNLTNIGGNVVNVLSIDSNGDLIHEYYEDTETDTIDLEDGVVGAASSIYAMFVTTKPITPVISEFSWLTSTIPNSGFDSNSGGFYSSRPKSGKLTVTI